MATWTDYLSLALTFLLVVLIAYAALFVYRQIMNAKEWSKERLQKRGVNISEKGMSVKRKTRLANREEYVDATQRGFIKALGSAYYGPVSGSEMHKPAPENGVDGNTWIKGSPNASIQSNSDRNNEEQKKVFGGLKNRND